MRHNGKAIQSNVKDFNARGKCYPDYISALNELITNSFFAFGVKNIDLVFFNYMNKPCLLIKNDGEYFTPSNLDSALSSYGCESANTAGNENGTGIKSCASYFIAGKKDSYALVISKKYNEYSYGLISSNGLVYLNYEDFDENDKNFTKYIKNEYLSSTNEGTVTTVFNASNIDNININSIEESINAMLTTGLNNILFRITYDGKTREIAFIDEFYREIKDDTIKRYGNNNGIEVLFTFTEDNFGKNKKIFSATVMGVDTRCIQNRLEYYNKYDEMNNNGVAHAYGFTAGYDNGYMPLYYPKVALLGLKEQPQYYYARFSMIAHPVEDKEGYATTRDWQAFYSRLGRVNAQKVPNYSKEFNFFHGNEVEKKYESFYFNVIKPIVETYRKWMPEESKKNTEEENLYEKINKSICKKVSFTACNTTYTLRLKCFSDDEVFVKFEYGENNNRFISFNPNHKNFSMGLISWKKEDVYLRLLGHLENFISIAYTESASANAESAIRKHCKILNKVIS